MTSASASASASAPAPAPTTPYDAALAAIDAAHALDPTLSSPTTENTTPIPYELHYARKCSAYLSQRSPSASPLLRLAIRAQHFRRWETPRSEYPATRAGYHAWRANAKKRQADLVVAICREAGFSEEESQHVGRLIRKEGLSTASSSSSSSSGGAAGGGDKEGDEDEEEVVVLEDVACLVFLDDQFAAFEKEHDQDKIVRILRKTWAKMSARGRDMALSMEMDGRRRDLVEKALKP